MKRLLTCVVLLFGFVRTAGAGPESTKQLEVHEWGTMTVVSGSDGKPVQWYQPYSTIAEIPDFVVQSPMLLLTKSSPAKVRMETPVIYFYPSQPMPVQVKVSSFKSGRLTEYFPSGSLKEISRSKDAPHFETSWDGDLLSPSDPQAARLMPPATGPRGAHYLHAREVPAAWYFHQVDPAHAGVQAWEKFIFYRGAGDAVPPMEAHVLPGEKLQIQRQETSDQPLFAFALQVNTGRARWSKLPSLGTRTAKVGSGSAQSSAELEHEQSLDEAAAAISSAMEAAIRDEGLSPEEAKAMVATWQDQWFRESGTRILALLPRQWVDSVLPLEIKPAPTVLKRVFIGRFELFTLAQEKTFLALNLAHREQKSFGKLYDGIKAMNLGRFTEAAVNRSLALKPGFFNEPPVVSSNK